MNKKRDDNYFDMFVEAADFACVAADLLNELAHNYTDTDEKIDKICKVESEADKVYHKLIEALNRAFITPIEREDIIAMAKQLDDLTDSIEDIALRYRMFNITSLRQDAVPFTELIKKSCLKIKETMVELKNYKKSRLLMNMIIDINTFEEEGDVLFRNAVQRLFTESNDPIEIIKWRFMFEIMEKCCDVCEDVADTVESVIMKNS